TLDKNTPFPLLGYYNVWQPSLPTVYIQQWNFSYQRQIGRDYALNLAYLGNKTTHQWLESDANPALVIPGNNCTINGVFAPVCSTAWTVAAGRFRVRLRPGDEKYFRGGATANPVGNANYNGLTINVTKRLSRNFSALVNYTWSHCISIAEQGTIN